MRRAPRISLTAAAATLCAQPAAAHGFGQRFDLPLPLWLWVTGAGATIVVSFIIVGLFVCERPAGDRYPRLRLWRYSADGAIGARIITTVRIAAAALFLVTIAAGLIGNQDPYRNLAPTMVWVIWWVGVAFASILIGDLWALVNPLHTLFASFDALVRRLARLRAPARLAYPEWLGAWPAILLFLAFAWAELVWDSKDVPRSLAHAIILYGAIAWAGMAVFGPDTWLRNGEAFSVAFGLFARFAPLDIGKDVALRPPGLGLLADRAVSGSYLVFVLLMLSTVTFDGFLETPLMNGMLASAYTSPVLTRALFWLSERGVDDNQALKSVWLVIFPVAFVTIYWCASWCMVRLTAGIAGTRPVAVAACATAFVLTLVPIAVAYHLAHYLSLLLTAGQFIVPLASDPFGVGWNLFGTAGYKVDIGVVGPRFIWYSAITAIVIGHALAVYLAHIVALRVFGNRRDALVSQIPMVALMVGYTMASLWILAQPIMG